MNLREMIRVAMFTPTRKGWGLPLLFWGQPGVGKSDMLRALAREASMHVETLAVGERGEGAFGVVPVPIQKGQATWLSYPPPDWALDFEERERGVVFVDELNTADASLQKYLLGLVLDRRIGSMQLGKGVRIVAATNPIEDAAGGNELAASVLNRFGHIDWPDPTIEEWCAWLDRSDEPLEDVVVERVDAALEEARVLAAWPAAYMKAAGLAKGFLHARRELLNKRSPEQRSWPTPRTWEFAVRAMAAAFIQNASPTTRDGLVASFIGDGTLSEWAAWIAEADLPDPEALLDGLVQWRPNPLRLDRTMAVLGSAVAVAIGSHKNRDARIDRFWSIFGSVDDDVLVVAIKPMAKQNLIQQTPVGQAVLARLRPLLTAVGALK